MITNYFKQSKTNQYLLSIFSVIIISSICYVSAGLLGYRTVGLILLATVSIQAIFFTVYPIFLAATFSALIWDYFFIPPHFTFHIDSSEDVMMLLMYFIIALLNGVLTSKLRQYEKLELQKEERKNTIKLYKTLFNSISHELRTPLAAIMGSSENLLQQASDLSESDKSKLITEISVAGFRLNRLIDNLLNMQRLESGLLKAKLDWCDLNELVNSPVNRLKDELSKFKLKISIDSFSPVIKLDYGLIEQAIFNILHNATLYTPINSTITIKATVKENNLELIIEDEGDGFTTDEIEKLFTKFYRVNKTTTGGTGLGLSIAKGFVEAHNGTIRVENNIPKGARFILQIPAESLLLNDYLDFGDNSFKQAALHEHKDEHPNN